jgi:hypothetical protein
MRRLPDGGEQHGGATSLRLSPPRVYVFHN